MSFRRGTNCSVQDCPNYKLQVGGRKSFFRMPKDPNLMKAWISACRSERLNLLTKSKGPEYFYNRCVVCSDHFELTCFRNKNLFSQGLIRGSIPTLKLYNSQSPIEEEIPDKTQEVQMEKMPDKTQDVVIENIWIDDEPNEELADILVVSDDSTSPTCTSTDIPLSLEEENIRLKQTIDEYKKKLNDNTALLLECREENRLLQEKLLQKNIVQNSDRNVADQKINFLRIKLADWE